MGNCEGGHYYSFIKNEEEQWYEFNDTQVTPSNIDSLKEEAFGGEEAFNNNGYKIKTEKNKSAYLLFYEKKIQTDCENFDNIEAIKSLNGNNNENNDKQENENENGGMIMRINIYNCCFVHFGIGIGIKINSF